MDRETANQVVEEHVQSDSLRRHLFAVETCMRAYARKEGEDEETWGVAGLLHDFDWEVCPTPESHPTFGAEILRARGFPEEIVRAVLSHGNHTGIARETTMEKALFACRRAVRLRHRRRARPADEVPVGHEDQLSQAQDEGQGVRQVRQPGRHAPGRGRARRRARRPDRLRDRRAEAGRPATRPKRVAPRPVVDAPRPDNAPGSTWIPARGPE